jgi:hypothetical protein
MKDGHNALLVFGALGLGLVGFKVLGSRPWRELSTAAFVDPASVAGLAATFPASDEDSFILAAWEWVGREIDYSAFGSELLFYDSMAKCQACMLPAEVVLKDASNCVGKASLLASILRNRLPASRVEMVIGNVADASSPDGDTGHAWVTVMRDLVWFLVEATSPPSAQPWLPEASATAYVPYARFNDAYFTCWDPETCFKVQVRARDCRCGLAGSG